MVKAPHMIHQAKDLPPEKRAAAELLLGRPLQDRESLSVQAFEPPDLSEERRRELLAQLKDLFAEVDRNLQPATKEEVEEIFTEAMRSSRPGFRSKR